MKSFLLFLPVFVFAIPHERYVLSRKENDKLQEDCGVPTIKANNETYFGGSTVGLAYASKWHPEMNKHQLEANELTICSGTIISPRHVLTAASCFGEAVSDCGRNLMIERQNLARFRVFADWRPSVYSHLNTGKEYRKVQRVFIPSYYRGENNCTIPQSYMGDAAVLEVDKEFEFGSNNLWPACLPDVDPFTIENSTLDYEVSAYVYTRSDRWRYNKPSLFNESASLFECARPSLGSTYIFPDTRCATTKHPLMCMPKMNAAHGGGLLSFPPPEEEFQKSTVVGVAGGSLDCPTNSKAKREGFTSLYTSTHLQNEWICMATGICANKEHAERKREIENLRPSSRPHIFHEFEQLRFENMFAE